MVPQNKGKAILSWSMRKNALLYYLKLLPVQQYMKRNVYSILTYAKKYRMYPKKIIAKSNKFKQYLKELI